MDSTIYQGCKLDSIHPYGVLLVRIGADDPSFIAIGSRGQFPAYRDGFLEFRIHDADACLVDNAGTVTVTVGERDNLPSPSWWNGTCDDVNYSNAVHDSNGKPVHPYLITSWRGIQVCGPLPWTVSTPDHFVTFPGGSVEQEFECTELVKRYIYLGYGINAIHYRTNF